MSAERTFKGASRWVTVPSIWGGLVAAGIAVAYGAATLALPPGTLPVFITFAAAAVVLGTLVGDVLEQRGLDALKALESIHGAPSREALAPAARQIAAIADRSFWINVGIWGAGALLTGIGFCLWCGAPFRLAGRMVLIGASMGPLAALVSHLLIGLRSRELLARLARAGLTGEALIAALPQRGQLRPRLVAFAALTVMVPTLLVTDVSLVKSGEAYEALLAVPTAEQPAFIEAHASRTHLALLLVGTMVVLLALGTAYLAGSALADPLQEISEEAQRVSGGQLRADHAIHSEDEIWAAAAAFMAMQTQLAGALQHLSGAGMRISTTTEQLVVSSSKHDAGAAQQVSALNQTSATTEELARGAKQIAVNATEVAKIAEQTLAAARGGRKGSDSFFTAMTRMKADNQAIADSVVKLNKRVQQIGKVVEFIHEIADKSDLLALNAELEGTKAGQVGRGFSLVAAEMRRLAESVILSTREIEKLIEEIRDATNAAVMATEAGVKATDTGAQLANRVSESLRAILELASSTSDAVRSISLATQQQQTGTDQLAEAMGGILGVTQQGAHATRKILGANSELLALSRDLQAMVERFRVGSGEGM